MGRAAFTELLEDASLRLLFEPAPDVKFTYHSLPAGKPDSEKTTLYVVGTKITDIVIFAPITFSVPESEDGWYPGNPGMLYE